MAHRTAQKKSIHIFTYNKYSFTSMMPTVERTEKNRRKNERKNRKKMKKNRRKKKHRSRKEHFSSVKKRWIPNWFLFSFSMNWIRSWTAIRIIWEKERERKMWNRIPCNKKLKKEYGNSITFGIAGQLYSGNRHKECGTPNSFPFIIFFLFPLC